MEYEFNMKQLIVLAVLAGCCAANAAEQTYVREYTYRASEADSKVTARAIALQEVKRELLNELGTHVSSLVKQQSSSDGTRLGTEEIETLSAGVTRVEILEERWSGTVYVLKAQIKADPEDVLNSLNKMLDADRKQKQISELAGELSKSHNEKIQIAESLTQSKNETTAALAEIARLRKLLEEQQTAASRQTLQAAYQQQVDQLSLNEWVDAALKHVSEGNYLAAFQLFQKAAEQGHARAQYDLGLMYAKGYGVERDPKRAVYWYQKAAEQGYANAQYGLGLRYAEGDGVERDAKKAVYWYQKAAEQGYANAQYHLGVMYYKGNGVAFDVNRAVYWHQKAAEQGYARAQCWLSQMKAVKQEEEWIVDPAFISALCNDVIDDPRFAPPHEKPSVTKTRFVMVGVSSDETVTAYADPASILKAGKMVKMWHLFDLKTARTLDTGKQFMSYQGQSEFDCGEKRLRELYFIFYSGNMRNGEAVSKIETPSKWSPIPPDSMNEALWKIACGKVSHKITEKR